MHRPDPAPPESLEGYVRTAFKPWNVGAIVDDGFTSLTWLALARVRGGDGLHNCLNVVLL